MLTWRHRKEQVYTFCDSRRRIWTVTNVPPNLRVPSAPEGDLATNKSMGELRRPQFAAELFPQAAFMITTVPVDDPLLSRISIDPSALPVDNNCGWRLRPEVQNSWKRLEKGLWLISDLLFDGVGDSVTRAVRSHESWDRPQDFGYLESFQSEYAARRAARRAHKSFLFLAARCSLAVACYQSVHVHKGPGTAPPWLTFLTERNVPACWLDALHRSIITQFSHGLRAGVAIDLPRCPWPQLIPVIRYARIPLLMIWENENAVKAALSKHQFAQSLVPHRHDWQQVLTCGPPPCTRDGSFHLYRHGQVRIHPEDIDDPSRPPHGPYQRPGERLEDFLMRQKRNQDERRNGEGPEQMRRRAEREAHANSGLPPRPRTRVYVWMRLGDALPAAPLLWHEKPYRMPVAPSAVRGLWAVQPPDQRHYNAFVDEWDMWLPPSRWLERHDAQEGLLAELQIAPEDGQDAIAMSTGSHDAPDLNDSVQVPAEAIATRPPRETLEADVENLQEDLRSLYPSSEDWSQRVFILFRADFVEEWYGLHAPYARTTEAANGSVIKYLHGVLGITEKAQPFEREVRVALAACVTAVLTRNTDSGILKTSWDLHSAGSGAILRNRRHVRWCKEAVRDGSRSVLFLVRFAKDATALSWTLVLSGPALVCLLRRGNIETSHAAVQELVLCGIAFSTVQLRHASQRMVEVPREPDVLDCRVEGYAAGIQDYGAYMVRVLEVLQRPHARAGLMKGGIVWRLMVEAVGNDSDLRERFLGYVHEGPSEEACAQAVFEAEGREYADDDLSRAELDVICGTYLTFTGTLLTDLSRQALANSLLLTVPQGVGSRKRASHGGRHMKFGRLRECTRVFGPHATKTGLARGWRRSAKGKPRR